MPTKPNHSGQQQEYVPAGNGDASGEYADNATGSNIHFKSFKKPKKDSVNIKIDDNKSNERQNLKTVEDNYNFVEKNCTFNKSIKTKLKDILNNADKDSVELLNNAYNKLDYKIKFRIGSGVYSRFREYLKTDKQDFEENGKYGIQGATWFHENGHLVDNVLSGNPTEWLSSTYKNEEGKTLNDIATEELRDIYSKGKKEITDIKQKYIDNALNKFDNKRYEELYNKRFNHSLDQKKSELYQLFYDKKISYEEFRNRKNALSDTQYLSEEERSEYEDLRKQKISLERDAVNKFYTEYATISDLYSSEDGTGFGLGHSLHYYGKNSKLRGIELFANLFSDKAINKKAYETTKKFFPKSVKMFEEIIEKYGK